MTGTVDGRIPGPPVLRLVSGGSSSNPIDMDGAAGEVPMTITLSGWYSVRLFKAALEIREENPHPGMTQFDRMVEALIIVLNGLRISHPSGKHPDVLIDLEPDDASPRADVQVFMTTDPPPERPRCG